MNTYPEKITIDVEPFYLEQAISGIRRLSCALSDSAYSFTVNGILKDDEIYSENINARIFLERYYNVTGGTFLLIDSILGIIEEALSKDDLRFAEGGNRQEMKKDYAKKLFKYNAEKEKLLQESKDLPAQELAAKLSELTKKYNL